MIRVGLSGGIGAGKSTAARALRESGAVLIDSDVVAREVVAPGTDGLAQVVEHFGDDVLAPDGTLDRPALAAKAFVDDESRGRLNAIIHPLVGARNWELLQAAPTDSVVVQDIPLLVENGMAPYFHLVVMVHASERERMRRLTTQRGMNEDDARARIRAQADDAQRRAVADVWLDNSGASTDLARATHLLWTGRLAPFEVNARTRTVVSHPVDLVDSDPAWDAQGRRLVSRLWAIVGDRAVGIEHIGSTAVPGLTAKPELDVQITTEDLTVADALAESLADGGFPPRTRIRGDRPKPDPVTGMIDSTQWGKRFHGSADPGRPANIHIRAAGSPGQRFAVDFRDWLRSVPAAREEYAAVKRAALDESGGDRLRYTDAKEPWFDDAYRRVAAWRGRRAE